MGALERQRIQWSTSLNLQRVVRQVNERLAQISAVVTENFRGSYPVVTWTTSVNGTVPLWIPDESVQIESAHIVSTTAAGTVAPQIDGVSVGGAPFSFTASVVRQAISSANEADAGALVSLVFAGLTGVATVTLNIRRLG